MADPADWFERRLDAVGKIRKLLALAESNPNQHEAASATERARRMAEEYGVDLQSLELNTSPKKASPPLNWGAMMKNIRRFAPGEDNEDYTKGKGNKNGPERS